MHNSKKKKKLTRPDLFGQGLSLALLGTQFPAKNLSKSKISVNIFNFFTQKIWGDFLKAKNPGQKVRLKNGLHALN
jgi:hypothetical protein